VDARRGNRGDAAVTQMSTDRARGTGLVAANAVGPGASSPASAASDVQMPHQMPKLRRVPGLAGPDQRHQRTAVAVDERVHFGVPAAAGAADRVVRRLGQQMRVVRPSPRWGG
jgi:hypothetical protein